MVVAPSVSERVCVIPAMQQIILSTALKQKGCGGVYAYGEATFSQEREREREKQ